MVMTLLTDDFVTVTETQWSFSNGDYSFNIQDYSFQKVPKYSSIVALSESVFKMIVAPRVRVKNGFKQK